MWRHCLRLTWSLRFFMVVVPDGLAGYPSSASSRFRYRTNGDDVLQGYWLGSSKYGSQRNLKTSLGTQTPGEMRLLVLLKPEAILNAL